MVRDRLLLAILGLGLALAATTAQAGAEGDYVLRCSGCHRMDGAGSARGGVPDLRGSVSSFAQSEAGRRYLMHVPGVTTSGLDDADIAAVMNYVMDRWGAESHSDDVAAFTAAEVAALRAEPVDNVVRFRRTVVKDLRARDLPVAAYPWP